MIALQDKSLSSDIVKGRTAESEFCVSVILGYYLFDLILVVLSWEKMKNSNQLFVHHLAVLLPFLTVKLFGELHYYSLFCTLTESSTLFINLHWFLSKTGKRNSLAFDLNLIGVLVTYAVFRLFNLSWLFVNFFSNIGIINAQCHVISASICVIGTAVILLFSLGW